MNEREIENNYNQALQGLFLVILGIYFIFNLINNLICWSNNIYLHYLRKKAKTLAVDL
jgi:hypothetical protein